ncbi:MAG: hypothetical protein HYR85_06940 [Planctomycetes bacterium]|nr:hypothetical protein [Planctomycetota bacterium]MBI3843915.1 hypothetical protein [Planctomycetota bacterium]
MRTSDDAIARRSDRHARRDRAALSALVPLVYDELRKLADDKLRREPTNHTLPPTALVHEAYILLVG